MPSTTLVSRNLDTTPMSTFADTIYRQKYAQPGEEWPDTAYRVASSVMEPYLPELVDEVAALITARKFMPGGRYLYAAGKDFHQTQNCLLLEVEDDKESWGSLMQRITVGLMTGAGVGVVYSKLREEGALIRGMGGVSTGPLALMQMVNEAGRHIMQGGSRRAAIWAGLNWAHPDIHKFIHLKDWSDDVKAMKAKNYNFPATMDTTNISVLLDDDFFDAYYNEQHPLHKRARAVYWDVVESMLRTGEPGFSIDIGPNAGEYLRNACTEITSRDDNDICNLGSLNLSAFDSIDEYKRAVTVSTAFLLCGTLYSLVPYAEVAGVRTKNRRLGLGNMGFYTWLVSRGKRYGPDEELGRWMDVYESASDAAAEHYAKVLDITPPIGKRAIAPTGTIAILAETDSGMEPMLAAAMKRRYLKGNDWMYQYVIDATAKRLIDKGIDPALLEDAYDLSETPERRLEFQGWLQQWVDHGISSTLNLPLYEKQSFSITEFGNLLLEHLPNLRGVTAYPDGARGGQPLTKVPLQEALDWEGYTFEEVGNGQACLSGSCGV